MLTLSWGGHHRFGRMLLRIVLCMRLLWVCLLLWESAALLLLLMLLIRVLRRRSWDMLAWDFHLVDLMHWGRCAIVQRRV